MAEFNSNHSGPLAQRTMALAISMIQLVDKLPRRMSTDVIGRQVLRSATSVGANYRAACRARSPAEFCAKLGIVEEEADETVFWLHLLLQSGAGPAEEMQRLKNEAEQIIAMVVASIRTARRNKDK